MILKWKHANKTEITNGNRADTNARDFWLVKRTLGCKNFMPENFLEININRFEVILQHDWSIEQCLLHIGVFFGGKTKSPFFNLFIHWLIKQITNTHRNHFSRSYENDSWKCMLKHTKLQFYNKKKYGSSGCSTRLFVFYFWLNFKMLRMFTHGYTGQKNFDQSEIRFLLESDKMRGVTKLKSKPKIAVKLSSHIKKLPLSNRIIACVIFSP